MSMIIIPIHTRSAPPPTCPECHKPERKVDKCAHCGHTYVYPEADPVAGWLGLLALLVLVGVAVYGAVWTPIQTYGVPDLGERIIQAVVLALGAALGGTLLLALLAGFAAAIQSIRGGR